MSVTTHQSYPIVDSSDYIDTDFVTKAAALANAIDTDMFGKQAKSTFLTNIAAIVAAGLLATDGSGAAAARTLQTSGSGISISNPTGAAGNPSWSLDSRLQAIVDTGIVTSMFATGVLDTDSTGASTGAAKVWSSAAAKSYVDNKVTGLTWKTECDCASTANLTLSGEQTIDGILTSGSRVLVKNQTTASQNGIYTTASGAWTRAVDADTGPELLGSTAMVLGGTANGHTQWTNNNSAAITIGSTGVTYVQIAGAGTFSATGGITLTGNQFALTSASNAAYLNGLTGAADKTSYWTGSGAMATTDFTSVARTLVGQTTQALMRSAGLGSGTVGDALFLTSTKALARAAMDLDTANTPTWATVTSSGALYSNDGTTVARVIASGGQSYWGNTSNHPVNFQTNNTVAATISTGQVFNFLNAPTVGGASWFNQPLLATSNVVFGNVEADGQFLTKRSANPFVEWWGTGYGTDAKRWQTYTDGTSWYLASITDAGALQTAMLSANRTTCAFTIGGGVGTPSMTINGVGSGTGQGGYYRIQAAGTTKAIFGVQGALVGSSATNAVLYAPDGLKFSSDASSFYDVYHAGNLPGTALTWTAAQIFSNATTIFGNTSAGAFGAKVYVTSGASTQTSLAFYNPGIGLSHIGYKATDSHLYIRNCYADGILANGYGLGINTDGGITVDAGIQILGGGNQNGNGLNIFFSSNVAHVEALQNAVAWRDLHIDGANLYLQYAGQGGAVYVNAPVITATGQNNFANAGIPLVLNNSGGGSQMTLLYQGATKRSSFGADGTNAFYVFNSSDTTLLSLSQGGLLTIAGAGTPLTINSTSSSPVKILFEDAGSVTGQVGSNSTYLMYWNSGAGANRAFLDQSGVFTLSAIGTGTVTATSGTLSTTSDGTQKVIKADFRRGLADMRKMDGPKIYGWSEDNIVGLPAGGEFAGWIAQDVLKGIPEAVHMNPNGLYSLDDRPISATMFNAIIGLANDNDNLRARIEALESKAA